MKKFLNITSKKHLKLCLIIASILIVSYDSYWFGTSGITLFINFRNLFLVLLPLMLFAINYKQKILRKNWNLLFFVLIVVCFSSFINGNGLGAPSLIFSGMMLGLILEKEYSINDFLSSFSDVILIISIYSLLIWVLLTLGIISPRAISNIGNAQMMTSYGCIFFPILLESAFRNSSIFREPGVYMILLNLSLIFELFMLNNKYRKLRVGILIASLLSTLSTAGIIISCIILLFFFFQRKFNIFTWVTLIIVVSIVLSTEIVAEDYLIEIFGKFETIEEYGSGFARYSSVIIPLNIFFNHPIWGCGFTQFPIEYERIGYVIFNRYVDSKGLSTNTFMNVFAIFGGFLGVYMLCGLYKFCKYLSSGNRMYTFVFCLIFFMMFSNESMPYFPFLYIFFYYGFNRRRYNSNKRTITYE